MTFGVLQQAVADRGFDFLQDAGTGLARLKRVINQAYQHLCLEELWPFLLTTTVDESLPFGVSDLRAVHSVYRADGTLLEASDEQTLRRELGDLTTTGSAYYWYLSGAGTSVAAFPVDGGTAYKVRYWKVPDDLSGDSDTPLVPAAFHKLIEDLAVVYLAEDGDTKQMALSDYTQGLAQMRFALLVGVVPQYAPAVGEDC